MHITITGNLGSGKSTVAKLLSEKYNFEVYSTGKVQRELARQMNLSTLELNQLMMSDRKYDHMIDDETARISRDNKDKNIIFDSRLAWHFVPQSFKVFVSVNIDVAAERIMNDQRGSVEKYSSLEEAKRLLAERAKTESIRYKDIYNLNYMDFLNYDLVIDSTYCSQDIIAEIIMDEASEYYKKALDKIKSTKRLISPKSLIFTELDEVKDKDKLSKLIKELESTIYAKDMVIKVNKKEDKFLVLDNIDYAKAAFYAGVKYLEIDIE
ncbi:MAG: AAA family ATPase [Clostridiales bacterium]|nr:AAA family ATPase [Clostridiales bacterium]